MTIIARFSEHDRYDINEDRTNVVFMATTAKGSFWSEVPHETAAKLREQRLAFKNYAAECISSGAEPCEIDLA